MTRLYPQALLLGALALTAAGCDTAPVATGQFGIDPFAGAVERPRSRECTLTRRGAIPFTVAALIHVDARINGERATLVVDTGAERSILSPEAAKRLGVTDQYDFSRAVSGIGETIHTGDARLRSLSVGEVAFADPRILVGPIGPLGADGLLGADLLGDFDLDLDGPRRQLT
ncbi:MAG: clan AA aspartic protease, partial [Acetobacteraceae bacterium]|nr:clan AA aspartic protease [Acetobacteraceae bacterium]